MGKPLAGDHGRLTFFRDLRVVPSFNIIASRQPFFLPAGEEHHAR